MVRSDGYVVVPDTSVPPIPTYKLSTIDNPFHPVYDSDNWRRFDEDHGYYTDEYLDRVYSWDSDLSDAENQRLVNHAVDDICRLDPIGLYIRIIVP